MAERMKAATVTANGLALADVAVPKPGPEQVLVRVRAVGLNRADLAVAAGHQHGSTGGIGAIPGIDWTGEVAEVGAGVTHVKSGDRVMCTGAGGYAEYAVSDMGRTVKLPDNNMSWEVAATLPVALQTMHNAIVTAGRFKAGDTVMIQGASSGVGLMGLQIAKLMGASKVLGSSTNPARRARLAEFGCDVAVDTSQPKWSEVVLAETGGKGVDLIVDQVSAGVANENLRATRILGRIVNVGRLGGDRGEFDFDLHAARRIDYIGVTFRTRNVAEVREIVGAMKSDLWGHVEAGRLKLPIDRVFPLSEVTQAVSHMRANQHFGKIIMVP